MRNAAIAVIALNFCGFALILASACYNQSKVGREALNFPLDWHGADQSTLATWAATGSKVMRGSAQKWPAYNLGVSNPADQLPLILSGAALSPGGRAISYLWWITAFQFIGIVLSAIAVNRKILRIGVVGVFGVLTTSTFLYTADVFSAPKTGIFALTHDQDLKIRIPSGNNMPNLYAYYKGLATLFVGLFIVDICNVFTMLLLPALDSKPEQAVSEKAVTEVPPV